MTSNEIKIGDLTLMNADCIDVLKALPDNCIDLILTDPPYYRVKENAWDRQWETVEEFLGWLDDVFAEFWRVLKPSGSLYVFCGSKLALETEMLLRQRMNVLNHIIWAKPSGPWRRQRKEDLRAYFPSTERVLFAEHYGSEGMAKGTAGYGVKCQELKGQVFAPLIRYFRDAREALGVSARDINAATGSQMCSHWFSTSQWQLPSPDQYAALQALFSRAAEEKKQASGLSRSHDALSREYSELRREYSGLVAEYDDLKRQYEAMRRPFSVSKEVPYTDVWHYPPVQYYPGKHPCEKPLQMMIDIINASSRPGDVVADFFLGGGNSLLAAKQLGRPGIGVELETERFLSTVEKLKNS